MHYIAHLDRQTSEQAGPEETFQVVSIEDDEDNNYTESIGIDQRIHFHSLEELAAEIERRTGEPAEVDEA
jgi:CO dehydrogenase nickel-insertion accessory protein CooC1